MRIKAEAKAKLTRRNHDVPVLERTFHQFKRRNVLSLKIHRFHA
jgi:hypothetical protein